MAIELYDPFTTMTFSKDECFLSGQKLSSEEEQISVFPEWILQRYELHDKTFTMLGDGNIVKYKDLKLPCAASVIASHIIPLEKEIETAFCAGYDEALKVPEERLFQWMAKLVYGILYHDFHIAMKIQGRRGERFTMSDFLKNKFRNLHYMLQSLIVPMEFEKKPWSIAFVKVKYSKDVFNYRDETNKLNFSLSMNGFGMVACLQDNGINREYHREMLEKIGERILHPIQFEELCGRFIYSNYLLKTYPYYQYAILGDKMVVENPEAVPFSPSSFNPWDFEMFGQVLATYWKPWGITIEQIADLPNPPISFLVNEATDELIEAENITLPF